MKANAPTTPNRLSSMRQRLIRLQRQGSRPVAALLVLLFGVATLVATSAPRKWYDVGGVESALTLDAEGTAQLIRIEVALEADLASAVGRVDLDVEAESRDDASDISIEWIAASSAPSPDKEGVVSDVALDRMSPFFLLGDVNRFWSFTDLHPHCPSDQPCELRFEARVRSRMQRPHELDLSAWVNLHGRSSVRPDGDFEVSLEVVSER